MGSTLKLYLPHNWCSVSDRQPCKSLNDSPGLLQLTDIFAFVPPSISLFIFMLNVSSKTLVMSFPFIYYSLTFAHYIYILHSDSLAQDSRHFWVQYLDCFPPNSLLSCSAISPLPCPLCSKDIMSLVSQAFYTLQHSLPLL